MMMMTSLHARSLAACVVVMLALSCIVAARDTYIWHKSGVGSPLRRHADFQKVGGACPDNKVVAGLRFTRGGCHHPASWTDSQLAPQCDRHDQDLQANEGLFLELDCRDAASTLSDYKWVATGVGAPLARHADFTRLGGNCPLSYVVTGVRFSRGGCDTTASWTEEVHKQPCNNDGSDMTEGLYLELQCAKLANADVAAFAWHDSGIGGPLASHADFEKVGGHCLDSQVVAGITFKRAGCHIHSTWDSNSLSASSLPPCSSQELNTDAKEGLIVALRCGTVIAPAPVVEEPVAPTPAEPETPVVVPEQQPNPDADTMSAHIPFDSAFPFHPIDSELFVMQVSGALNLPASFVKVLEATDNISQGRVAVTFLLHSPLGETQTASEALVRMVVLRDPRIVHTYLGIPGASLQIAVPLGPEPPAQYSPTANEPLPAAPIPVAPVPAEPVPAAPIPTAPAPAAPIPAVPVIMPVPVMMVPLTPVPATPPVPTAPAIMPIPVNPTPAAPFPPVPLPPHVPPMIPTESPHHHHNGKPAPAPEPIAASSLSDLAVTLIVLGTVAVGLVLVAIVLAVVVVLHNRTSDARSIEMNEACVSSAQRDEEGGLGYIMHQPAQPQIFWNGAQYVSIVQQDL